MNYQSNERSVCWPVNPQVCFYSVYVAYLSVDDIVGKKLPCGARNKNIWNDICTTEGGSNPIVTQYKTKKEANGKEKFLRTFPPIPISFPLPSVTKNTKHQLGHRSSMCAIRTFLTARPIAKRNKKVALKNDRSFQKTIDNTPIKWNARV